MSDNKTTAELTGIYYSQPALGTAELNTVLGQFGSRKYIPAGGSGSFINFFEYETVTTTTWPNPNGGVGYKFAFHAVPVNSDWIRIVDTQYFGPDGPVADAVPLQTRALTQSDREELERLKLF